MTNLTLKKEIHKVIDNINDTQLLEAVYTILNSSLPKDNFQLSEEDLHIIEGRKKEYKLGKSKTYTVAETKKKILKNLRK